MTFSTAVDWTAVGSISTALALLLGIGTLYWQHRSQIKRDEHDRSRFALDSCLVTYRTALEQLENGNNDRVTWITSARMIQRANELSALVTEAPHIAVLEVEKELFRNRAATVLGHGNPAQGAWFFLGAARPNHEISSVVVVSHHPRRRNAQVGHGMELSLASIATVYELASFPRNYEEPLPAPELEKRMGVEMRASFPGLFDYLTSHFNHGDRDDA
jgi:hypothetical protein